MPMTAIVTVQSALGCIVFDFACDALLKPEESCFQLTTMFLRTDT